MPDGGGYAFKLGVSMGRFGSGLTQPATDSTRLGFLRENLQPTAKTNELGRIGLESLAVGSVEADKVLPEVPFGQ